jgi:hypothetical protein
MKNEKKTTKSNEKPKENVQGLMKNEKKTTKSEEKPKENDKA